MTIRSETERINALFVVPSLRRAGAETQVVDLVNGLDNSKFKKTLVAFESGLDLLERLDTNETSFHHFLRKHKYDMSVVPRLARLIDERDIDIIHCTLQIALLFAWAACRVANRKPRLVVAIHTTTNRSLRMDAYDWVLYRPLVASCDRVIFVCNTQAEHWKTKYSELKKKSVVIYNGVDTKRFSEEACEEWLHGWRDTVDIPAGSPVVACVAGFRQEKGHAILIDAFSQLGPDSYLVLVGDGVLRPDIESCIKAKDVSQQVRLVGEISDVRPVLAASDVTVLASTSVETFSIAMLESMSMGVPVVATDIGGLGEAIIPGVTGELVKPGSVEALRLALSSMLSDPDRITAMGQQARLSVLQKYSKSVMVDKTEALLLDVVSSS